MTTTKDPETYLKERHDRRKNQLDILSFAEDDFKLWWDVLFPEEYEKKGIKIN